MKWENHQPIRDDTSRPRGDVLMTPRRRAWLTALPVLVYLVAWTATTVVAAVFFVTPGGQEELRKFVFAERLAAMPTLGSEQYHVLLFTPFLVVPFAAIVGARAASWVFDQLKITKFVSSVRTDGATLFVISAFAAAYCFYALWSVSALVPDLLFGANTGYKERILARARLMSDLGFLFYTVPYAILPMTIAIFLTRLLDRVTFADVAGFIFNLAVFIFVVAALYMKSPIMMLALVLVVTVLAKNPRLIGMMAIVAGVTVAGFVLMQTLIGGVTDTGDAAAGGARKEISIERISNSALLTARAAMFRMASAYPFYIEIFRDPVQRCGIETNSLPGLSAPRCVMATKVFAKMYPDIDWTTGFSPAAAHVSAYGEVGLGYALIILIFSGLSIGGLGAVSGLGSGPLFTGLTVATCAYAYYLTQVPFLGALTYAHGLIFFLIPSVAMGAASLIVRGKWLRVRLKVL